MHGDQSIQVHRAVDLEQGRTDKIEFLQQKTRLSGGQLSATSRRLLAVFAGAGSPSRAVQQIVELLRRRTAAVARQAELITSLGFMPGEQFADVGVDDRDRNTKSCGPLEYSRGRWIRRGKERGACTTATRVCGRRRLCLPARR